MDAMKYLTLEQKYMGQIEKAAAFLTKNQLLDREMWGRFVDQFRRPIDGTNNGWRGEYWGKMMRGASLVCCYSRDPELYEVLVETVRDMLSLIGEDGRISSFTPDTEFRAWTSGAESTLSSVWNISSRSAPTRLSHARSSRASPARLIISSPISARARARSRSTRRQRIGSA